MVSDSGTFFRFLMYGLAVYRVTLLLYHDRGMWDVLDWLRAKAGVEVWGEPYPSTKIVREPTNRHIAALLVCSYCISFYVTLLFAGAWFQGSVVIDGIVFIIALWGLVTALLERSKLVE